MIVVPDDHHDDSDKEKGKYENDDDNENVSEDDDHDVVTCYQCDDTGETCEGECLSALGCSDDDDVDDYDYAAADDLMK